jgi:hypothetical protein
MAVLLVGDVLNQITQPCSSNTDIGFYLLKIQLAYVMPLYAGERKHLYCFYYFI